jgi:amino acid transporter
MATQIAKYGSMFKFIPILTIVLAGLIYGIAKGQGGLFTSGPTGDDKGELSGNLGLGCLAAVPAVLFAFNGFSGAGAISSKLDNPQKQLPKILSFGMILVGVVYVVVALAQLLSGAKSAFGLFINIFGDGTLFAKIFTAIISFFIFACALVSTDCLTLAAVSSTQAAIEDNKFAFSNKLLHKTKNHESMAGGIVVLAT